jgi:hypothetical protein
MRVIFWRAGVEKPHPSIEHVATVSAHPHKQANRAPTRDTATFWLRVGICDQAVNAQASITAPASNERVLIFMKL